MISMHKRFLYLTIMATVGIFAPIAHAEEKLAAVGLGFEFTSGDYGTGTRTNSVLVPLTIEITPTDRWDFSLEIPYVYQSNTNVIAGQFRQMQGTQMTTTMAMTGQPQRGGMGNSSLRSSANNDPSKSQNGLGDIKLRAGYVLIEEADRIPRIRPTVAVKFPTADKDKGLGTGEFDEEIAVTISKWFGDWYTFIEPGYTIQGKSADLSLKDYVSCNGGFGYQVTDNFQPLFILKGSSAIADGGTELLEARLKLKYQMTRNTGIEGYLAKGITTSSPDYGTGLTIFYDF